MSLGQEHFPIPADWRCVRCRGQHWYCVDCGSSACVCPSDNYGEPVVCEHDRDALKQIDFAYEVEILKRAVDELALLDPEQAQQVIEKLRECLS